MKAKIQRSILLIIVSCTTTTFSGQLNAQDTDYANALNNYSFDLYHTVKNEKENFLLSPLNTYYTLLMAYEGAENRTKQAFEKVLHIKDADSAKNPILPSLAEKQDNYTIANAIWVGKGFRAREAYRNVVEQKYSSDFLQTDFRHKASAVSDINGWVSEKTNRKINEIINESDIGPNTQFLISNALYFKGEWLHKFDRQKTISDNFFTSGQEQYREVFMQMTENFPYYENHRFQFISKPYKDSHLSFCIILPKELFGLDEIEKTVNADSLQSIVENAVSTRTSLYLPKFNLESGYRLGGALRQMGLGVAFSDESDFSGITEEVPLALEEIAHKTIIELDEEKTEAAAATATAIYVRGTSPSYKIFKADHPFMFFVMDNRSKAILFMGRYMKPAGRAAIAKEQLTQNMESRKKEPFAVKGWGEQKLLYIVDGKAYENFRLDSFRMDDIESFNVIKNKKEMQKYAPGDYDGAIIITMKKEKKNIRNFFKRRKR